MKKFLTAIIVTALTACNQTPPKGDIKTMDFGAFTMETPQSWKQIKAKGIDSHVGSIAIDNKDNKN